MKSGLKLVQERRVLRIGTLTIAMMLTALESRGATEVTGVVQDPSVAAVPGAQVTLALQAINHVGVVEHDSRTVKTDASGVFSFPTVPAGVYQIIIVMAGFKKEIHLGVKIPAEGIVSLPPFVLSIGDQCPHWSPSRRRRLLWKIKGIFVKPPPPNIVICE